MLKNLLKIKYKKRINKYKHLVKVYKIYQFLCFKVSVSLPPIYGKNNHIYYLNNGIKRELTLKELKNLKIEIIGNDNEIIIPEKNLDSTIVINGNSNKIHIQELNKSCGHSSLYISLLDPCDNRELFIDENCFFGGVTIILYEESKKVKIGKNCMLSSDIDIWTTDHHPIYDLETKERLNFGKDILIGNNVWIGKSAKILKGCIIPDGSIVGIGSIVTKPFEEKNCIIAGNPAKIIKKNICWDIELHDLTGFLNSDIPF